MPYLQELFDKFIDWTLWTSVMFGGFGILALIIGIIVVVYQTKVNKAFDVGLFIGAFFILPGLVMIFFQAYDIIECLTFPEKTLYDYISYHMM